jgi:hypothetical protein
VERRRIPYERERWLSAVLIVTSIAGVSVVVPRWPLAIPPAPVVVAHLPARALPLIDPPGVLPPGAQLLVRPSGLETDVATLAAEPPAAAVVPVTHVPRAEAPASAAVPVLAGGEVAPEHAVLASRRVDLAGALHPLAEDDLLASSSPSSSHAFVEIPAVVVTRAVVVAGRGIRTGLRATSAVIRAAF